MQNSIRKDQRPKIQFNKIKFQSTFVFQLNCDEKENRERNYLKVASNKNQCDKQIHFCHK